MATNFKEKCKAYETQLVPEVTNKIDSSIGKQNKERLLLAQVRNLQDQRRNFSNFLNKEKFKVADLTCQLLLKEKENLTAQGKEYRSSESGGFCNEVPEMRPDARFTNGLCKIFLADEQDLPVSIASFGEGPGYYKRRMMTYCPKSIMSVYDGYDGSPIYSKQQSDIETRRVEFIDFTAPVYGIPVYDWIISLEVAEHIPKKYEATFLDNIVRHAKTGVILSWARPGQVGVSHVNCQDKGYVIETMENLGFEYHQEKTSKLVSTTNFRHLRRNIRVFYRNTKTHPIDINEA